MKLVLYSLSVIFVLNFLFVEKAEALSQLPPCYKYRYDFYSTINESNLPSGVELKDNGSNFVTISNKSDIPLILKFTEYGSPQYKLVSGLKYDWNPIKQIWVKQGEMTELGGGSTGQVMSFLVVSPIGSLRLNETDKLPSLPLPESYSIEAHYGDSPLRIKGTVTYVIKEQSCPADKSSSVSEKKPTPSVVKKITATSSNESTVLPASSTAEIKKISSRKEGRFLGIFKASTQNGSFWSFFVW